MTKAEFLAALGRKDGVDFGGSTVHVPTSPLCALLLPILDAVIGASDIRFAVQTSSFKKEPMTGALTWDGRLTWLLVLHRHLLEIVVTAETGPDKRSDARGFHVSHRLFPIASAIVSSALYGERRGYIERATATVKIGADVSFEVPEIPYQVTTEGIFGFVAAIRAAQQGG